MNASQLFDLLNVAAQPEDDEALARLMWRASDYMWRNIQDPKDLVLCRTFNDLLQDIGWLPWVDNLWSKEEIEDFQRRFANVRGTTPQA